MSDKIRPEVSEKNKYWVDRHRYYELKHFCMQYPLWKRLCETLDGFSKHPLRIAMSQNRNVGDPTAYCVEERAYYTDRIRMLEEVAVETDPAIGPYILEGVTKGLSYNILNARREIPCGKDMYYELYRRFFWLLDRRRK